MATVFPARPGQKSGTSTTRLPGLPLIHTDNNDPVSGRDAATQRRLVGSRHGVGDNGELLERERSARRHRAEFTRGDRDVRSKAAVHTATVAGHFLTKTPVGPTGSAKHALPAGEDCRNNHLFAQPGGIT